MSGLANFSRVVNSAEAGMTAQQRGLLSLTGIPAIASLGGGGATAGPTPPPGPKTNPLLDPRRRSVANNQYATALSRGTLASGVLPTQTYGNSTLGGGR